jgi:putative ABC transport system ATP-binding protein
MHLNKAYKKTILFCDFNLSIEAGKFVVVTGDSGSGKTTLLSMIGGLEKYDSGQIVVDGIDIGVRKNRIKYYRDKVGF